MAKRKSVKKNVKEVKTSSVAQDNTLTSEAISAALSSINTVMIKVCRLCETKDGPFLNIFGAENMTAKKIDDILPFVIAENDDLPHKICFRCSAKVEEFYEFVQKCVKTQENLRTTLGKNEAVIPKVKTRAIWEEKLNESNISNDDICDALIRKAMEGLKDLPIVPSKTVVKDNTNETDEVDVEHISSDEASIKDKEKETKKPKTRLRTNNKKEESPIRRQTLVEPVKTKEPKPSKQIGDVKRKSLEVSQKKEKSDTILKTNTFSIEDDSNDKKEESPKPFDIMDHVSMIKVNGVGILFQCKLCNRNFLKKEVVLSHACAKNGGKKVEEAKPIIPDPPRIPMIKYINTRVQNETSKTQILNNSPINLDDDDDDDQPLVQKKTKPRIGPASKVKRVEKSPEPQTSSVLPGPAVIPNVMVMQPPNKDSTIKPNLDQRYKFVPGPNNSLLLVVDEGENSKTPILHPTTGPSSETVSKVHNTKLVPEKPETESVVPYPVGLIKKVSQGNTFHSLPESFTTPAMRKQMYTVVQTGNPSKLLISTKSQAEEELPKKKARRSPKEELNKKPYSVTVEVNERSKDGGFFTFVNVDPLLQPSYVLPTDNNIQESQITTSTTAKPVVTEIAKYSCNMCSERFTREKKLITHLQSHYDEMDREDELRAQKNNPKKRRSKT